MSEDSPVRRWFGPSLLRRTVVTLVAAMLLVWVVLSFKDYVAFKRDVQALESLGRVTQTVLDSLQGFDAAQARAALVAADRQFNELRRQKDLQAPGALLFQLNQADGALVYRTAAPMPLPDLMAIGTQGHVDHLGMSYWPMVRTNAHWRLAVWAPAMADRTAIGLIGMDVLSYLLLALPFVVVPMVLAVWQGLRPLRQLAQRTALRPHDDLSPLQEPTGYAELTPLVEAFNALLARAGQQREREQAFVQDAAHELKTPLAVVSAQAHVLATAQNDEQRSTALQALEQGIQRASHQVSQLLTLAALDHVEPPCVQRVDIVEAVRDTLIELEPLAQKRAMELMLQSPERLMEHVDTGAFRLVLSNLVRNAIQHGATAGVVAVHLHRQGNRVCLQVCDDGPGIPVAERERVFDRFYRATSTDTSGSGLGLAIVKRAAQRLGADVLVADGPGARGTLMQLTWLVSPSAQ